MHLGHPIAQARYDHVDNGPMAEVDRVAATAEVLIVPRICGPQAIEERIVHAAVAQGGPVFVALGRVVEDDIEEHLETRLVQSPDHRLELADLLASPSRGVGGMRGDPANGVVPEVVGEPELVEMVLGDEMLHRHQLDGGDAESREDAR